MKQIIIKFLKKKKKTKKNKKIINYQALVKIFKIYH